MESNSVSEAGGAMPADSRNWSPMIWTRANVALQAFMGHSLW